MASTSVNPMRSKFLVLYLSGILVLIAAAAFFWPDNTANDTVASTVGVSSPPARQQPVPILANNDSGAVGEKLTELRDAPGLIVGTDGADELSVEAFDSPATGEEVTEILSAFTSSPHWLTYKDRYGCRTVMYFLEEAGKEPRNSDWADPIEAELGIVWSSNTNGNIFVDCRTTVCRVVSFKAPADRRPSYVSDVEKAFRGSEIANEFSSMRNLQGGSPNNDYPPFVAWALVSKEYPPDKEAENCFPVTMELDTNL